MSFKSYFKRGIQYIIKGVPEKKVYANVFYLAPSELLHNRTALITGGTSGIGYEIAKAFINAGAKVIITGRSQERIDLACSSINEEVNRKGMIKGVVMDNTMPRYFQSKLSEAIAAFGNDINILVNNAGIVGGEIKDCSEEKYMQIVDTNLKGVFFLSQCIAHYMKERDIKGNILNIGSSSSLRPATSAYSVTKNAVLGLTRGLAKVLAPYGITVNGLAPGPTATPMLMPNGVRDEISFPNPLGRYILPGEIANMAVFLVSEMGRSIIGDMVFMTGGSGIVTLDDVRYDF